MKSIFEVEAYLAREPIVAEAARVTHGAAGKRKVEKYLMPELWSVHLYEYNATLLVEGHEIKIRPGSLTLLPAGAHIEYHFNDASRHRFAHFKMRKSRVAAPLALPAHYELGADCGHFERTLEFIAAASLSNPTRANVKLWELLWELADRADCTMGSRHPSLDKALALIELRLAERISVSQLAHEVGLSHNQLTRLFRAEFDRTVAAHICQRRAERALHLLRHSTLPIKDIAAQIGIQDPRTFNALMKKETGRSPRICRNAAHRPPEHKP